MSETPTSLTFKYGLFGSKGTLVKGDIGFARYTKKEEDGTEVETETGTLILKTPSDDATLLNLMPAPGALGCPLVGQGASNSPKYDVLKLVGGGTGVTNLTNNRMLFVKEKDSIFTTGNHYINENKIAINKDSEPNENLSILGTVRHNGNILVTEDLSDAKQGGSITYGAINNARYLRFNFGLIRTKEGTKQGRMITVIIKGNSYSEAKMPFYSMYQFYYYTTDDKIQNYRGQCFGGETGDLKLYRCEESDGSVSLRGVLFPPYNDANFSFKTLSIEIQYSWTEPKAMTVVGSKSQPKDVTYEVVISPNFNPKTNSTLGAQQVLMLGNNLASGAGTNGMAGWLRLYGSNTGYADIIGPPTTSSLAQKLPNRQGSIAVLDATDNTFDGKILFSSSLTDGTQVLTKTSHSVDATRLAINTALPVTTTDDSTLLVNGKTTVETLVISKADGGNHILFSRANGLNYLVAPVGGSIAFCINNTANAEKCPLIISANTLYPHETNSISLGTFSNAWKQLYLTTKAGAWISGKIGDTSSAAAITFVTKQTSSSYHPMIATKTYSGHSVTYGGLKDTVGFYGYYSDTTDNKTDWSFTFNSTNGNISATGNMSIGSITPKATNAHNLGSSTHIWNTIYNQVYRIYDASNKVSGGTLSTETNESTVKEKHTTLTLGNATASTAINNRTGRILLYGNGTTYSSIYASNTTANTRFTLPAPPTSQTNYFAMGDSVGDAYRSTLLKPTVNTSILTYTKNANSAATAFSWPSTLPGDSTSTKIAVWGERFAPTDVTDPGDIVMWLERKSGATVNTLNVLIDGFFYQNGQNGYGKVIDSNGGEITGTLTTKVLKIKNNFTATVQGPDTANGTFYFPNTGGTFVTHPTRGTAVGSASLPVYIASTGRATQCTASSLFSAFTSPSSNNVLSLTIAGQTRSISRLIRPGISSGWIYARDKSLIQQNSLDGYSPFASIKTNNGDWAIGAYNNANYTDELIFSYVTDADYSAKSNKTTTQIRFSQSGVQASVIWGSSYLRSSNYGSAGPGTSTPGYGTVGAIYFKII